MVSIQNPGSKPAVKKHKRDAIATRARILKVAIAEFSAKGYSGARIAAIARRARINIRMIYHYFSGKDALYVTVLEYTLSQLRAEELQLDFSAVAPLEGLMQLFAFIDCHFSAHPELMQLLSSENLNKARFLQKSTVIPVMATPVLVLLERLLQRGAADGSVRPGIDALHFYVTLVSLAYFPKSNAHTLSGIFAADLLSPFWQHDHGILTRRMVLHFLMPVVPVPEMTPDRAPALTPAPARRRVRKS